MEVLVVTAVVSILAAVVYPVLSRSKLRSMQSVSASQMRQHFAAVTLYAADHNDRMVFGIPYAESNYRNSMPDDLVDIARTAPIAEENLFPYGLTKALLHAPNDPGFQRDRAQSFFELVGSSYVLRRRATLTAIPLTRYEDPAKEPMEYEIGIYYDPLKHFFTYPKRLNVLYFDGSTRFVTWGELMTKLPLPE